MFATPQWEPDVPSTNVEFQKLKKKKESAARVTKVIAGTVKNNKIKAQHSATKKQSKSEKQVIPGQFVRLLNVKTTPKQQTNTSQLLQTNALTKTKKKRHEKKIKSPAQSENITNKNSNFEKKPVKIKNIKKRKLLKSDDLDNLGPDNLDSNQIKKRKLNTDIKNTNKKKDQKDSDHTIIKMNSKKEKIKKILELGNRNSIKPKSTLREKMMEKLKAAQFRYLNEKLYTSTGTDAMQLFQSDPTAFNTYHEGYQLQLKKWPINPLDVIVKRISKMPKTSLIADMGCGEGLLSSRVPHNVRSFDLVSTAPGVESCDMAKTPLLTASIDVAVYCLSLMGTDLTKYLIEANRVLKVGGMLLVAEVESRFENVDSFIADVQRLGFSLLKLDKTHNVFLFMEFKKIQDTGRKSKKPLLSLKPCLYKRR